MGSGLVDAAPGKRHTCSPSAGAAFPQGPSLPPDCLVQIRPITLVLPACQPLRCALKPPTQTPDLFAFPVAGE